MNLVQITVFQQTVNSDFISAGWEPPTLMVVTSESDWCVSRHRQAAGNLAFGVENVLFHFW